MKYDDIKHKKTPETSYIKKKYRKLTSLCPLVGLVKGILFPLPLYESIGGLLLWPTVYGTACENYGS